MEEILKRMIEQLQSLEWGEAQENVDGALAYLSCAVQKLRNPTTLAVDTPLALEDEGDSIPYGLSFRETEF